MQGLEDNFISVKMRLLLISDWDLSVGKLSVAKP